MSLATFTGWALVGIGIAAAICARRKKGASHESDVESDTERPDANDTSVNAAWCEAVERICGSAVLLLDSGLKLVACGSRGHAMAGAPEGAHIIDVVPPDAAARFLDGAAAARRGDLSGWECEWNGKRISARAAPLEGGGIIMVLGEMKL